MRGTARRKCNRRGAYGGQPAPSINITAPSLCLPPPSPAAVACPQPSTQPPSMARPPPPMHLTDPGPERSHTPHKFECPPYAASTPASPSPPALPRPSRSARTFSGRYAGYKNKGKRLVTPYALPSPPSLPPSLPTLVLHREPKTSAPWKYVKP